MRCRIPLSATYSPHDKPRNQISGVQAKISGGKAQIPRQQRPSYLQQEEESCDAYSDRLLALHHHSYPVRVGPCRYARATTLFRAENVITHIANCARPLTEDLAVQLEDLSERFPTEWAQALTQNSRQGGTSINPAPIPRVDVVLKLGLGWNLWVKVQQIAQGWLARRQFQRLRLRQWQMQCRLHGVMGSATRKY